MWHANVYTGCRRGGVLRRPRKPLTRFFQGRRGRRAFSKHTPPLCSPHGCAPRRRLRGQPLCGFPLETPPSRRAGRNASVVSSYLTIPSGLRSAARCTGGCTRGLNARPPVACAPVFGAHLCRFRFTAQDRVRPAARSAATASHHRAADVVGDFRPRIRPRATYARLLAWNHHSRRYAGRFKITVYLRRRYP